MKPEVVKSLLALLAGVDAVKEDTRIGTPWWILRHRETGKRLSEPPRMYDHPQLGSTFLPGGLARRWRTKKEALQVKDAWRQILTTAVPDD